MIRQPIICVMGHVDHGKTSVLDSIRSSAVASREAGGITQHIGASEVPMDTIRAISGKMLDAFNVKVTIPGLLFIDTPGHEAFTNLRKRGGSVSDMAILVVDITKGLEPQTLEAIEILRSYKTPFIVAANKIDLITGWRAIKTNSFAESYRQQQQNVQDMLMDKVFGLVGRLSELGFSSDLFSNVKDFQKELAIVPLSAKTKEGIAELLVLVTGLSQRFLEAKLNIEVNGPGKGTILERKEVKGLGTTIDIILYDGSLRINDIIAFATENSVVTTKVKALLRPKPLSDIREARGKFFSVGEVSAATGVKISANDLDGAMAGSPVMQVTGDDYKEQIKSEIGDVFSVEPTGAILKADSIGSVEALSKLLAGHNLSLSKKGLGNVSKRDVMDAFAMNAKDQTSTVILAFSVGVDADAEEAAYATNVKIIRSDIIYKLVDDYTLFVEEKQKAKSRSVEESLIFPGKVLILPNSCFRASHPAIFGVKVVQGRIRKDYPMMGDDGGYLGRIKEIQSNGTSVDSAKKGDEVAISMDGLTFGRQLKDDQVLFTRVLYADERLLKGEYSTLITDEERALLAKISDLQRKTGL